MSDETNDLSAAVRSQSHDEPPSPKTIPKPSALHQLRQEFTAAVINRRRRRHVELQPPSMSVMLDGKKVEPKQVAYHPSQSLNYIVSPVTYREGTLQVFARPEAAAEYLATVDRIMVDEPHLLKIPRDKDLGNDHRGVLRAAKLSVGRSALTAGYYGTVAGDVDLYEHDDFGGWGWTFLASWGSINDFRWVFPPFYTNINDRVSAVNAINIYYADPNIPYLPYVILFEHINKGGAQLWLHPRGGPQGIGFYPRLGDLGWNDVASSMRYY